MLNNFFFSYIISLISVFIHIKCYSKICRKIPKHDLKKLALIIILVIIIVLCSEIFSDLLHIFITLLIFFIIFKSSFKTDLTTTALLTLVLSCISISIEFLCTGVIYSILKIRLDNFMWKTLLTIIYSMIYYLVICIPFVNNLLYNLVDKLTNNKIINTLFICIISIVSVVTILYGLDYNNLKYFFIMILALLFIFSLTLLVIVLLLSDQKSKIENKNLILNIQSYKIMKDDFMNLNHNVVNDFLSIRSIGNKKVQALIDEKIQKYHKPYKLINDLSVVPDGLQGIIYLKLNSQLQEIISCEIISNVDEPIDKLIGVKLYSKLCDVFSIVIDNAIEAATESAEKVIYLNFNKAHDNLSVKVINTFANIIDIEQIGKRNYTTKETGSGIGLNYLNKLTSHKMTIKKEIFNNLFKVTIVIKLKQ